MADGRPREGVDTRRVRRTFGPCVTTPCAWENRSSPSPCPSPKNGAGHVGLGAPTG